MKVILQDVTLNQVSSQEVTDKKTGEIKVYRAVDIFIPKPTEDEYGKAKAISARVADNPVGIAAFNYLQSREGQKVTISGIYTESRSFKGNTFGESLVILNVIDSASIKTVEMPKNLKAAA